MRYVETIVNRDPLKVGKIVLGRRGENGVTDVIFDFSEIEKEFGEGTPVLYVRRVGDAEARKIKIGISNMKRAYWTITEHDTAIAGIGAAEFRYHTKEGQTFKALYETAVLRDVWGKNERQE